MRDMTAAIKAYGEAKKIEEDNAHREKVRSIYKHINYIVAHGEDFDIMIANANAALEAGIKVDRYRDSRSSFEDGNFYANGIRHRLGFLKSDYSRKVVGLGVIGGGCNGDVSVAYINGEVIYDTDKYYDHNRTVPMVDRAFQALHPLESMNDRLLAHYEYAFKTFVNDIDAFSDKFEKYLLTEMGVTK